MNSKDFEKKNNHSENENLCGKKHKIEKSVSDNSDEDNSKNDEDKGLYKNGRWEKNEHYKFLKGCLLYGNNWKKVKDYVKTRSSAQIRSHAQKYIIKLCKKFNVQDSKHLKNLKSFRKNPKNGYINNLSLNLNESSENLDDINSLDMDTIEETILGIFKAYDNLNEKKEDKSFYSNKSDSNESDSNKNLDNGKIFDTTKIEKKNEKNYYEIDESNNNLFKDNIDMKNLLNTNFKGIENFIYQNNTGKSLIDDMNPTEISLLMKLINESKSNPFFLQNTNLKSSNSTNPTALCDEIFKILSNQNNNNFNLSNFGSNNSTNNSYSGLNNNFQNISNNFSIYNGLNSLIGINPLNFQTLNQSNQISNPNSGNIMNDINLLNNIIFANNNNNSNKINEIGNITNNNPASNLNTTINDILSKQNINFIKKNFQTTNNTNSFLNNNNFKGPITLNQNNIQNINSSGKIINECQKKNHDNILYNLLNQDSENHSSINQNNITNTNFNSASLLNSYSLNQNIFNILNPIQNIQNNPLNFINNNNISGQSQITNNIINPALLHQNILHDKINNLNSFIPFHINPIVKQINSVNNLNESYKSENLNVKNQLSNTNKIFEDKIGNLKKEFENLQQNTSKEIDSINKTLENVNTNECNLNNMNENNSSEKFQEKINNVNNVVNGKINEKNFNYKESNNQEDSYTSNNVQYLKEELGGATIEKYQNDESITKIDESLKVPSVGEMSNLQSIQYISDILKIISPQNTVNINHNKINKDNTYNDSNKIKLEKSENVKRDEKKEIIQSNIINPNQFQHINDPNNFENNNLLNVMNRLFENMNNSNDVSINYNLNQSTNTEELLRILYRNSSETIETEKKSDFQINPNIISIGEEKKIIENRILHEKSKISDINQKSEKDSSDIPLNANKNLNNGESGFRKFKESDANSSSLEFFEKFGINDLLNLKNNENLAINIFNQQNLLNNLNQNVPYLNNIFASNIPYLINNIGDINRIKNSDVEKLDRTEINKDQHKRDNSDVSKENDNYYSIIKNVNLSETNKENQNFIKKEDDFSYLSSQANSNNINNCENINNNLNLASEGIKLDLLKKLNEYIKNGTNSIVNNPNILNNFPLNNRSLNNMDLMNFQLFNSQINSKQFDTNKMEIRGNKNISKNEIEKN